MDVKESKEALIAVVALGKCVAELAKDGIDLSDGMALGSKLVADAAFRGKLMAGVQGVDKIPLELKDLAASEALELIEALVGEIKGS